MKSPDLIYGNVWSKVRIEIPSLFEKVNMAFSFEKYVYNPKLKRKERKIVSLLRKTKKENWYYFPSGLFYLLAPYPDVHKGLLLETPIESGRIYNQLRPYQKDYVNEILKHPRGIIDATTGSGKTIMMAAIIERINPEEHILIIVPKSSQLLLQLVKNMQEFFGEDEVGYNFGEGYKEGRIMITSPGCAGKLSLNVYRVCFLEECHHAPAKGIKGLLLKLKNAVIRYGFSGSPFGRSDQNDLWTVGLLGEDIKLVSYEDLKDAGYLAECDFIQIFFDSSDLLDPPFVGKFNDWQETVNHFFLNNNTRNEIIKRIVDKAILKGRKILIITDRIEHGKKLGEEIENSKFIFSKTTNIPKYIKALNDGKLQVLISTSLIDTGIDIPALDTLILASIGKSKIQLLQRVGRTLRPESGKVKIIDLVDSGSPVLFKHAMERQRYVLSDAGFNYVSFHVRNIKDIERL